MLSQKLANLNLKGNKVEVLSQKLAEKECDEKYNLVRKVYFETSTPHGLTFEEDGHTVKAVGAHSQAEEQSIGVGWKAFKLDAEGVTITGNFLEFLDSARKECTIMFGVPGNIQSIFNAPETIEEERKKEEHCVHVHVRFLLSRLYNVDIPQETFEADLFVEFMWRAPWDLPAWEKYMESLEKYSGYKDLLKVLDFEDWKKPDLKPYKKPSTREEEVYYSERIVRSFDRQINLEQAMGTAKFVPTWIPRIIFANMRTKNYDEMNFGDNSYSMVNVGNTWYTVWRRNISNAVFLETFELMNFPFDIQELTITVLCAHPKTRVKLVNHKCYRGSCVVLKDNIMLPEWNYMGMRCSVGDDKSGRFSIFTFEAEVRRYPDYFVKSGQFIFTSITLVSFLVFGIPAEHDNIGDRLSYGSTMLLTTVAFKWLISEKIPNLPYDTYLDDYGQWGFNIQICIMVSNGAMLFVRFRDDDGEIDSDALHIYDLICFGLIFSVWAIYQIYAYFIRVPRIVREESKRLTGMTDSRFEKVDPKTLAKMTGRKFSPRHAQRASRRPHSRRHVNRPSKRPRRSKPSKRIGNRSPRKFFSKSSEEADNSSQDEEDDMDYHAVYSNEKNPDESSY